jgi:hypothetical protein
VILFLADTVISMLKGQTRGSLADDPLVSLRIGGIGRRKLDKRAKE